jgi:DNA-binding PadR family transcriptional regulator
MWPFRWMTHHKRGLRMWALSLLAASPKNGVEIINEIEALTRGWWRPSPGSVYPLLEQLGAEGLVTKRPDGRYELTPKAQEEIDWPGGLGRRPHSVDEMVTEVGAMVSYLEELAAQEKGALRAHAGQLDEIAHRLSRLKDR